TPFVLGETPVTNGHEIIYQGKLVYKTNDNVMQPSVCNGKLIFLSDEGRGAGMYALRTYALPKDDSVNQ
ncbi:MAG TPA: hypothetical protein VL651_08565, partial [Bacteroidia bacterium]|nr:hypothetical protein [Bacteroidia bacterium]